MNQEPTHAAIPSSRSDPQIHGKTHDLRKDYSYDDYDMRELT